MTHAQASALLTTARDAHTLPPKVLDHIANVLRRHPEDCDGVRHILGRVECFDYREVLDALGIETTRRTS